MSVFWKLLGLILGAFAKEGFAALREWLRDRALVRSGEDAARLRGAEDALDRAKQARQNASDVARLDDDALDDELRADKSKRDPA